LCVGHGLLVGRVAEDAWLAVSCLCMVIRTGKTSPLCLTTDTILQPLFVVIGFLQCLLFWGEKAQPLQRAAVTRPPANRANRCCLAGARPARQRSSHDIQHGSRPQRANHSAFVVEEVTAYSRYASPYFFLLHRTRFEGAPLGGDLEADLLLPLEGPSRSLSPTSPISWCWT
jgi:hypothetical protein